MTQTAPVWQTETSSLKWRGKLVVIELILNIAGFSLSNWMTYGFSFVGGPVSWRFPLAFQLIFMMILYATVPWLPESPRWLIAHEYEDEAFSILAALEDKEEDDPFILAQHKEIVYTVQYERQNAVPWSMLLRGKTGDKGGTKTIRRLLLGAGTQAMQQLSGINVTSYYLPTVLIQSVKLDNSLARLLAACNSVSYLLFSLIGIPNVERWGRRNMMIFASSGQCFCYFIITILIRYSEKPGYPNQKEVASGSVAFFFLYYVFFGIGMQGVPWLYPTEINSLSMRTKGAAIGTATNWIFNFMVRKLVVQQKMCLWKLLTRLTGRRNHPDRHPNPPLEILHRLDRAKLLVHPVPLLPLPRDSRQNLGSLFPSSLLSPVSTIHSS